MHRQELETSPRRVPKDLWFSIGLLVLSLVPRLYVGLAWSQEPVWDGHYYDFGARRIAAGFGYSDDVMIGGQLTWHPWCHYPVGYSGFLAFFYWIFGAGPKVGPIVNAVVGALTCLLIHRLALTVLSVRRARIAGVLCALHPGLIVYTALLMTEPLAGCGLLLAAWAIVRGRKYPVLAAIVAGMIVGCSTLVRPPSILLAPALFFLTTKNPRNVRAPFPDSAPQKSFRLENILKNQWASRLMTPVIATAVALLTVLPWTVRNCRVMDGCAFVSTNAGWNLMIGAFPRATGRFETVRAADGCRVVTGQVQQDNCFGELGRAHIRENPSRWLLLAPKKLGYTFDHESFPIGYLGEANPAAWPEERKEKGRVILTVFHRLLLILSAFAAIPWPSFWRKGIAKSFLMPWAFTLVVVFLAAFGVFADAHPSWPLVVASVVLPALAAIYKGVSRSGTDSGAEVSMQRSGDGNGPKSVVSGAASAIGLVRYLAFLVGSVALVSVVFFGEDRYHMVASPALCLLAACLFSGERNRQ